MRARVFGTNRTCRSHSDLPIHHDPCSNRKFGCLQSRIDNRRGIKFHAISRGDVSGDSATGNDRPSSNLSRDGRLITNIQRILCFDFTIKLPINPNASLIGEHALKLNPVPNKSDNVRRDGRQSLILWIIPA